MAYLAFAEGTAGAITYGSVPRADPVSAVQTDTAALTALEWLAVAVSRRDSLGSLREPGRLGTALRSVFGLNRDSRLADPRLEALRRIAVLSRHYGYTVPSREVTAFLAAGFDAAQYELLVNSIGAERQAARRASLGA
jgi:hypothetical protein